VDNIAESQRLAEEVEFSLNKVEKIVRAKNNDELKGALRSFVTILKTYETSFCGDLQKELEFLREDSKKLINLASIVVTGSGISNKGGVDQQYEKATRRGFVTTVATVEISTSGDAGSSLILEDFLDIKLNITERVKNLVQRRREMISGKRNATSERSFEQEQREEQQRKMEEIQERERFARENLARKEKKITGRKCIGGTTST